MSNQYSPTSLRDSGKGMDEVAEELRAEWEKLKVESEDFEGLFGDGADDVGGLLRMVYEPVHQLADESLTSAMENFQGIGELLRQAGDLHEETENANAEMLTQLKSIVENVRKGDS